MGNKIVYGGSVMLKYSLENESCVDSTVFSSIHRIKSLSLILTDRPIFIWIEAAWIG